MKERVFSLILFAIILLGIFAACQRKTPNIDSDEDNPDFVNPDNGYEPAPVEPPVISKQFRAALDANIAWDELAYYAKESLTAEDAVRLAENCAKAIGYIAYPEYLKNFAAENSGKTVTRGQLAQLLWCVYVDITYSDGAYLDNTHQLREQINASAISYIKGKYSTGIDISADENEVYDTIAGGWTVVNYVIGAYDRTNGDKLMPLYDDNTFRPKEPVSVEDAVGIFLRFSRSFEPDARYVSVENVGTHTIDAALYSRETSLPNASNENLPDWKGFNISFESMLIPGALSGNPDDNFYRAEIEYIKLLGANFAHIYLSWSWFQGPDYTCNSMVNLTRLERLDEIISCCMEEDIHIQLVFNDIPNYDVNASPDLNAWFEASNTVFTDSKVRDDVTSFWRMLARRYADIPNNYLSFNLMNECDPPDDESYAWGMGDAVKAIWEESPGRVIVADVHSSNITGESMAELGCALSFHLYEPRQIAVVESKTEEDHPGFYENLRWPTLLTAGIIYGPDASEKYPNLAAQPVTLSGKLDNAELYINFGDISFGSEIIQIAADDALLYDRTPNYEYIPENEQNKPTEDILLKIPVGTKKVTITCTNGYAFSMNQLKLFYPDGTVIDLNPQFDWWGGMEYVDVHVGEGYYLTGTVCGKEVASFDFCNVEVGLVSLNELLDIGAKHGVDVMIGECGIFENGAEFDFGMTHETATAFIKDELELFESLDLAWACELYGRYTIMTPAPFLDNTEYKKAEGMPYYVNLSMEKFFMEMLK